MTVRLCHIVDESGAYLTDAEAQPDRTTPGAHRLPRGGTFAELPAQPWPENTWPQLVDGAFQLVPDFRGVVYWLPDGSEHRIESLGVTVPPEGLFERPALLPEAKAAKLAQIERDRDEQATASVNVHGRTWQADERSQKLLSGAIQLHYLTGYLPALWRDEGNQNMALSDVGQLVAIAAAIAQQTDAAYSTSWVRKAALEAAQTVEEVNNV